MNPPVTTHPGPLGSTFHVLRADAETVTALAAVDWNRHFSLVGLDPVRGLVTLMTASHLHGLLSGTLDDIVDIAGSILTGASRGLRHSRLRGPGEPLGTGIEPTARITSASASVGTSRPSPRGTRRRTPTSSSRRPTWRTRSS